MKKLAYMLSLVFLTLPVITMAQTATGTPDANYSIYKNKLKKSEDNLTNEKKTASPKFWLSRAELMMNIFELHREFLKQGSQPSHLTLIYGEPQEVITTQGEDGSQIEEHVHEKVRITFKNGALASFEETMPLYENPLDEALRSLNKAEELDTDGKSAKTLKEDYTNIKSQFERLAIERFFKNDFEGSFHNFAAVYSVNQKPLMEGAVDTMLLYYAGMAASKAEKTDEAIKFYEMAREYNCPEPDLFIFLKQKYFEIGDTAKGIEILGDGFAKHPDNQGIVIELINYYLINNRAEEALEYLRIAQEDDPTNLSFIFAEATLYDKMGDTDEALATYQRCLEIDPNYFNAYYNIGVMYYNKAVEMYKAADEIKTPDEYGKAQEEADVVLKEALPYMEKANEIDPEEPSTLETLKTLYYRMGMTEKYEELKAKLESMPAAEESGKPE